VIESQNTITDSGCLDELDPAYLTRVVSMCPTTCLNIHIVDVYNPDSVAWHNTSLVKVKAMLLLGCLFVLEVFGDLVTLQDYFVCLVFDLHFLFLGD
jgi:hypothetical protein